MTCEMITVEIRHRDEMYDWAEAETPEAALLAARTLWDEASKANPIQGWHKGLAALFFVDGKLVRMERMRP